MGVSWSNAIISGDKGFIVIKVNIDNKDYFLSGFNIYVPRAN